MKIKKKPTVTIDSIPTRGVLLINQCDARKNGLYVVGDDGKLRRATTQDGSHWKVERVEEEEQIT